MRRARNIQSKATCVVADSIVLCLVALVACFVVVSLRTSWFNRLWIYLPSIQSRSTKHQQSVDDTSSSRISSICDLEAWVAKNFFTTPEAIRACEAISTRKPERLQELIASGLDVNLCGESGMTLLHCAFANNNLAAFKLLLEHGADPDKKFKEFVISLHGRPWLAGDSVLFTCMRENKWEFFFAALNHTRDTNQLGACGLTFLLVATGPTVIYSVSEDTLQRLIDTGTDLDAQNQYGDTAAMSSVIWDQPLLALRLLRSGANPDVRNKNGRTLADLLSGKIRSFQGRGKEYRPTEVAQLQEWLESRCSEEVELP